MRIIKVLTGIVVASIITACSPKVEDGAKFVGTWHTAAMSAMVSKQNLLEITHDSGDKYISNGWWVAPGSTSGKVSTVWTIGKDGLMGPNNDILTVDSKGILHADGEEYSK